MEILLAAQEIFRFLEHWQNYEKATIRFMSVRQSAWNDAVQTGRIFMKLDICVFFENPSRNFEYQRNLTGITGNSHEDQ